ncbi:Glyoxylase, beta-lactamase superfamily II [Nakamurella panacisegetis]|uniref:Glyoxylase, beta-lactamase superfamily II n=1 Tax=Nakamurella panacisegetis TaxID=1090615 RepID=A0A1H0N8A7_9ACTN|nr:MBL fold metallo-hydrolase [Nakamurella panacisegetis]SDO88944.1 Glyoxylase, beta-lactamase superfamily II [Nakamurella panacisegetis]
MSRTMVEVASGVLVATSRREVTTSTVVVHAGTALLVDPAWDPDELSDLADFLEESGLRVEAGFSTHAHHDHVLWHPGFGGPPRWASPAAADLVAEYRGELVEALGPSWPVALMPLVGMVRPLDGDVLPWDGPRAEIVVHDGHSAGHAAVWLPGPGVLLAGDMLSDVELPLAQETGLAAYDQGLTVLLPYVRQARVLVPGHGHPTSDPMRRWEADRRYLDAVLAGHEVSDPRLANMGMRDAHAANLAAD